MFNGCFDDSSDGLGSVVSVAAGWVADEDTWVGFNQAWDKELRDEIDEFHAVDCDKPNGQFKDWSIERRDDLRLRLLHVIHSYKLSGLVVAINVEGAQEVIGRAKRFLGGPNYDGHKIPADFLLCMQYCLVEAYRMTPVGEIIQIAFDKKTGANGRVPDLVKLLRAQVFESADRISKRPPEPKDSKDVPGLQAADMLAYEVKRHAECGIKKWAHNRWIYKELTQHIVHGRYFCDDAEVATLVNEWKMLS